MSFRDDPLRNDYYIIADHPNGPTLTTHPDAAKHWAEVHGCRVYRVEQTQRVFQPSPRPSEAQGGKR